MILCFNHCYGIFFEKFPLKKSWCCRKHVLVFEIVSLKGLNKLWSNHSFPIECWVEDLFAIMEKVWKLFHFGNWLFKLNFWVWEGDFWVEPLERSNLLAVKVKSVDFFLNRGVLRGEGKKEILCFRVCFWKINILVESWESVEKRENLCESFTRKDILSFKKCLGDGNLWFLPFSFHWLCSHFF
jgi:hypothetical protein